MSTAIPFRAPRIHAQFPRRQCLFQRRSSPLERPFSSTSPRARSRKSGLLTDAAMTRAMARHQVSPAPRVNLERAQQNVDAMQEDIGLLQGTIVRAPFKKIGSPLKSKFWSYFWNLLKSKATGLYSRSHYRGCSQKSGWSRFLPVDAGKNAQLKEEAKKAYVRVYENFARGNLAPLKSICLPPLVSKFETRIAARGALEMHWKLLSWKSARVVSHRASAHNEDIFPDTAYRQAIVRLESVQTLDLQVPAKPSSPSSGPGRSPRWTPAEARQKEPQETVDGSDSAEFPENGKPQTVIEYLVLQQRVVRGKQEEWKVWGFAKESTPASLKRDDEFWRKTLDANLAT